MSLNKMQLPRFAFIITTHCNLKCKLCAAGVPVQKAAYHMDIDEFHKGLTAVFSLFDTVDSLEFGGGEPFLHSDLPSMIEAFEKYKARFKQWLIVTNGTVPPDDKLISVMERYKDNGILHLSDYNVHPEQTQRLLQILDEIKFPHRIDKYYGEDQYQGGWVDPGEMVSRNRSQSELREIFSGCGIVKNGGCWRLYKGKIHFCTRSARCYDEGFDFPSDYVDLFNPALSIEQKSKQILSIHNAQYIMACNYCNGDLGTKDLSKRFPAGEQISRGRF